MHLLANQIERLYQRFTYIQSRWYTACLDYCTKGLHTYRVDDTLRVWTIVPKIYIHTE